MAVSLLCFFLFSGVRQSNEKGSDQLRRTRKLDVPLPGQPPASICTSLPGFTPLNTVPVRGPLITADYFINKISGGSFVEIGSRYGDISKCISFFANKTIVIEENPRYCAAMEARGLDVVCTRLGSSNAAAVLPLADAYFWWLGGGDVNREMLKVVHNALLLKRRRADVYYALDVFDTQHVGSDAAWIEQHFKRPVSVDRLFFDESISDKQEMDGLPVAEHRNTASYKNPYFGFYGRWGVMNILHVSLGK